MDTGSYQMAQALQQATGAGAVYAAGFFEARTRQRINVNRPTEQVFGPGGAVLRQWASPRARRRGQGDGAVARSDVQ